MANHPYVISCQEAKTQRSRHLHKRNTLKKLPATNVKLISSWAIPYTLHPLKGIPDTIMSNAGKRCFFRIL